jgi:hypothetical protein
MKYKNFQKIPQITRANYKVHVPWNHLEKHLEHLKEGNTEVIIEPEFQRAHVWTEEQQIKYIEWIMRGGESGKEILWNCAGWMKDFKGPVYLVDGLQRITAVRKFLNNEVPAFGTLYKDFSGHLDIISCNFIFYVNDLENYEDVLKWYLDINDGGTIHTEMELNKVRLLLEKERTK